MVRTMPASLRALAEAGVKIDLVAGHGIGAVGAVFAALDGGARLWEGDGLWRRAGVRRLYGWRTTLRVAGWSLAAAALVLIVPVAVLAARPHRVRRRSAARNRGIGDGRAASPPATPRSSPTHSDPPGFPMWLPRLALLVVLVLACGDRDRSARSTRGCCPARRRQRGGFWWAALAAPMGDGGGCGVLPGGAVGADSRRREDPAAGHEGPRPPLRRAARRQPRTARLPRAAHRRARPRCAARPRVRAARAGRAPTVLPAQAGPRRRAPVGRGLRSGRRRPRPEPAGAGRRAGDPGAHRARADAVSGREPLARRGAPPVRSAGCAGTACSRRSRLRAPAR